MPADPVAALLRLLDEEREGLLRGRLSDIAALGDRKVRLLAALPDARGAVRDIAALARVRAAADRNRRLLEAAALGLRDVQIRLAEVRRSAGSLATYSSDGVRQTVDTGQRTVERRC